jgi:hypothetical protein
MPQRKIKKKTIAKPHKKHHRTKTNLLKVKLIALSCMVLLILFFSSFYIFANIFQTFSANFADNVLRPILGNKMTINIESVFFGMEDRVNQVRYSIVKSNPSELTQNFKPANESLYYNPGFSLEKISAFSYFPLFPGENEWDQIYNGTSGALMAKTFVRPDKERSYAVAYLVKLNMNNLALSAVAGTTEPGGYQNPGPGKVPIDAQKSGTLVAAFNGGFQQKDGHYGMIVNGKTYLPLQKNLATLLISNNQKPQIINYTGQDLGGDVTTVRQNGPLLLENSKDVTSSTEWNMQTWGLTTTNSMYTWRSGLGVTQDGNLVYAAGPSLVPQTLALALKAAGAINAMQLDINPVWVRFIIFNLNKYDSYNHYSLTKDMIDGGSQYLTGYQKDFFYLTIK